MEAPLGFFEALGEGKMVGLDVGWGFEGAQLILVFGQVEVQGQGAAGRWDGWLPSHVILIFELHPFLVISYPSMNLHFIEGSLSQKLDRGRVKRKRI